MNVAESRDFKIGGRTYRDTLIGRDVHQISNPSTGHVYGEVVQIPADGRAKAYYLAGPNRERAETWEAAVQSARAQQPDPVVALTPTDLLTYRTTTTTSTPPAAPVAPPPAPTPDTTGWLTCIEAQAAYNLTRSTLNKRINQGVIQAVKVRGTTSPRWLVIPPPPVASDPPARRATSRPRKAGGKSGPPVEIAPAPVAAAETTTPEPKITIRPAGTKIRELEDRIARLEAERQPRGPVSFWARLFGAA